MKPTSPSIHSDLGAGNLRRARTHAAVDDRTTRGLLLAAGVYAVVALIYCLISWLNDDQPALALLHIGSAMALATFWRGSRWHRMPGDSFGPILVLLAMLFELHGAVDALVYGSRLEDIPSTVPVPESLTLLLLEAITLRVFGTIIVAIAWSRSIGHRVEEFSFTRNYRDAGKAAPLLMYVAAWAVEIVRRVVGADFGGLAQISNMTFAFGVAAIFFVSARYRSALLRLAVAVGMALPLAILASASGMKTEIFFPFLPAAAIFWFGFRNWSLRALAMGIALFIVSYSHLYVQYVRLETWATGAEKSSSELLFGFKQQLGQLSLVEGMDAFSSRLNMTSSRAITLAIAQERGLEPDKIFGAIPASVIPRLLWPTKPEVRPGAEHTLRIRDIDADASEATTSTAAGFFSEAYLGGAYVGWLFASLAFGYLLGKVQLYTLRRVGGFGHLAVCFFVAFIALRFEELALAYAYTSLWILFVFVFFLRKLTPFFHRHQVLRSR